jgi:hypothetical protein
MYAGWLGVWWLVGRWERGWVVGWLRGVLAGGGVCVCLKLAVLGLEPVILRRTVFDNAISALVAHCPIGKHA